MAGGRGRGGLLHVDTAPCVKLSEDLVTWAKRGFPLGSAVSACLPHVGPKAPRSRLAACMARQAGRDAGLVEKKTTRPQQP